MMLDHHHRHAYSCWIHVLRIVDLFFDRQPASWPRASWPAASVSHHVIALYPPLRQLCIDFVNTTVPFISLIRGNTSISYATALNRTITRAANKHRLHFAAATTYYCLCNYTIMHYFVQLLHLQFIHRLSMLFCINFHACDPSQLL